MQITLEGNPIPKLRARHTQRNGFVRTFDPQDKEKHAIRIQIVEKISKCFTPPEMKIGSALHNYAFSESLIVFMIFHMPIPKSDSKKKKLSKLSGDTPHTNKPDIDNLVKFYLDCGNELLWSDDSIISIICAHKKYSDNPKTQIYIYPYTPEIALELIRSLDD